MKKSNKVSVFYVLSSVLMLFLLLGGGIYGIYISVGLNFVKSSVSNITEGVGNASNVSYGGTVNFQPSMAGIIILSIILIVLSVLDFIALIKQITFFKQFKMVRESALEQKIEKKTKSKSGVIFFVVIIDLLSLASGIAGIFINIRSMVGSYISWVLYAVDALVSVLALVSLILLIIKLKSRKGDTNETKNQSEHKDNSKVAKQIVEKEYNFKNLDVDNIEYQLLKLKNLKASKVISNEEYKKLHDYLLGKKTDEITDTTVEETQNIENHKNS